jgi:hypothetical protein
MSVILYFSSIFRKLASECFSFNCCSWGGIRLCEHTFCVCCMRSNVEDLLSTGLWFVARIECYMLAFNAF